MNGRFQRGALLALLILSMLPAMAMADVRNAAPVQGGGVYAVPWIAVIGLVGVGLFVLWFAFTCPAAARPFVLTGATGILLFPYVAMMFDLSQYPDAFSWWDAFLLPAYCVFLPEAYASVGTFMRLVLPCLIILIATLLVPTAWILHFRRRRQELQTPTGDEQAVEPAASSGGDPPK